MPGPHQQPLIEPVVISRGSLRDLVEMRDVLRAAGVTAEIVRPPGRGGG